MLFKKINTVLLALSYVVVSPFLACYWLFSFPLVICRGITCLFEMRKVFYDVLSCPQGHPNKTYGLWQCNNCHARYLGWVYRRCPICGLSCGYFPCEICGLAIKNPIYGGK